MLLRLAFLISFLSKTVLADCTQLAGIERPGELPDYNFCTLTQTSGCRGWAPIGKSFPQADLMQLPSPGRFYIWESGNTICYLLKRGSNSGLNGIHCYNTKNCKVCSFDGEGTTFNVLQQGSGVKMDCAHCHVSGPILPNKGSWEPMHHLTSKLSQLCASNGGPEWVESPQFYMKNPDLSRRVEAPQSCNQCHTHFVMGGNYCNQMIYALQNPSGAMKKYGFDLDTPQGVSECQKFSKDMDCNIRCSK